MLSSVASRILERVDVLLAEARATGRDRALNDARSQLKFRLARAFLAQARAFMRHIESTRREWNAPDEPADWLGGAWERSFDAAARETSRAFVVPLENAVRRSLRLGAEALTRDLRISMAFDLQHPLAQMYVHDHGAALVARVNDVTREYLRTVIERGVQEGWSYDRIAQAIIDRYEEFAIGRPQLHIDSRAHLIAVTETGNAYEEGAYQIVSGLRDLGLQMEKSWLTVGDDRVEETCMNNEAQGWIGLDEQFPSGHLHPLAHPACRCTILYRRKQEPAAEQIV